MNAFVQRHADHVTGMLSGFDRIRFRGTSLLLANVAGLASLLSYLSVLLKDFGAVVQGWSDNLRAASMRAALEAGRPVQYLPVKRGSKEEVALQIARADGIEKGLICVLTAVEPCMSFEVRGDRASGHLVLKPALRKCLHLYHYFMHEELGFCNVRVQSWLPFNIHVCINGREMLAREMDRAGIAYQRADNCFARVSDVDKTQLLFNQQLNRDWSSTLDRLLEQAHPGRRTMLGGWVPEYYWSMQESEWASDVMFRNRAVLAQMYPKLIRQGMIGLSSGDVMRYLGKRVGPENRRFGGEISSDIKQRGEGMRIKHRLNSNSIKMYDKQGSVLRVETTINDPSDFKVYRRAGSDPQSKLAWRLLRKGVVDIKRRAQVCQAANDRYLEAMASVETSAALGELTAPLCRSVPGKTKGERARGLNPLGDEDAQLLAAVARGEFAINGFRNRDLRRLLYGPTPPDPKASRSQSSAATRRIRLLRAHGLVNKVSRTHRYVLSDKGRRTITAILAARTANASKLLQAA